MLVKLKKSLNLFYRVGSVSLGIDIATGKIPDVFMAQLFLENKNRKISQAQTGRRSNWINLNDINSTGMVELINS